MAVGSSINPRMLLALIQYYTGWVQGQPKPGVDKIYTLGYHDSQYPGLFSATTPDGPGTPDRVLWVARRENNHFDLPGWRHPATCSGFECWNRSPAIHVFQTSQLSRMAAGHRSGYRLPGDLSPVCLETPGNVHRKLGHFSHPILTQPVFTLPFEVGVLWDSPVARMLLGSRKAPGRPGLCTGRHTGLRRIQRLGGGHCLRADCALRRRLRGA